MRKILVAASIVCVLVGTVGLLVLVVTDIFFIDITEPVSPLVIVAFLLIIVGLVSWGGLMSND